MIPFHREIGGLYWQYAVESAVNPAIHHRFIAPRIHQVGGLPIPEIGGLPIPQ